MGPPQTLGAPVVPKMGVRARVSNWSKKQDIGDVQPPPRVDSLGLNMLHEPSKELLENSLDLQSGLETRFQVSRRTLLRMKRSNSELTISDFGSEDVDPVAINPNTGATLTRRYGSSSSVDLLSSSGFWEVLRVDQEPSAPPSVPEPAHHPGVLSPSLQAAVQIASGDIFFIPGGDCVETSVYSRDSDKVHRRKTEISVLSRLRPQKSNRNEVQQDDRSTLTPHRCFSHYDVQSVLLTIAESQPGLLRSSSEAPDLLPSLGHEELNAGTRSNSLVLACPQFLNEVGGEMERSLDLTEFSSSTSSTTALGYCSKAAMSSCTNAAVSILEASTETQLCSANLLGSYGVEYLDLGAKYYQKYFYNKDHQNYFGTDPKFGPVSLSIRREVLDDGRNPTKFNYRIILRTGQLSTLRGSIVEDSVPSSSKHGTSRGLPLKDVLEFVLPELNIQSLRVAQSSPRVPDLLLQLDQQELVLQHRVDLLLSRAVQNTGDPMFTSKTSCPALTQFINLLSHSDPMKSFYKYQDQQNSSGNSPGSQSVQATFREFQLTFHVSGLLPAATDNTTQVLRKRLVGNDDVTVIFQEPDVPPFNPQNIRSDFQCVFIVVRVHRPCSQHTCYSLAVSKSRGVPPFGPPIPPGWMFPASSAFVDFLLTKIINAKHATRKSESFVAMATRTRQEQLKKLVETFVTTTPLDFSSNVRFSFISLAGKKKERLSPRPLAYLQSAGALTWSVTVRDPSSSAAVACRLAISGELVVLVEEAGREVVFNCSCRDVIGWSAAHGSIKLFYRHGLCVAFSTRDGRWEDSQEITQRLQMVTQGGSAAAVTLRRNRLGQLGFHVNFEGVVADVEAHGFAWQAGLRPGCRLVEICSVAMATLSHEEMIELLRTSSNVSVVILPPHRDGTPRRSFSETHQLPMSDVTSRPYAMPAAPPTARAPTNQSPVQRSSSSDLKEGSSAAPDWLISSDESTESPQDRTSRTSRDKESKHHHHHPPPHLPHHGTRALSPAESKKQQKFAGKSCSSCSNTLSSNSSDGRTSTPQLVCLRGASVDSGIDSTHCTSSAPPQVAGATLVLTDVLGAETATSSGHVTDFRGAESVSRDSCGSRCSSADRMKVRPHADSPEVCMACSGDSGWDAEPLYSQDTCPWETGLYWFNRRSLLEETTRPSSHPIRDVCGTEKSTCRASDVAPLSARKRLTRSKSHDSLSIASCGRSLQKPAHILRRHRSVPPISRQPPPPQKAAGVFPPSSLSDNQLRFIQEVTSGSPPMNSDITASLSGKVSQLEKILHQLQLHLLREQQDKAALQQQVLNLRQDNLRLQEESHSAAEQIRRFTTWMLRRGSLP